MASYGTVTRECLFVDITRKEESFQCALISRPMTGTAALLSSLDIITAETTTMLSTLDDVKASPDRHEAKRRVLEIRGLAQELFDWLGEVGVEEARN
jgi:hypothetical protein